MNNDVLIKRSFQGADVSTRIHVASRTEHLGYFYGKSWTENQEERDWVRSLLAGYNEVYLLENRWFFYNESRGGTSRSHAMETKEDAIDKALDRLQLVTDFWENLLAEKEAGDIDKHGCQIIRCQGEHYAIGKESNEDRSFLGFGGRKFIFKILDTGKVIESHNVWSQGTIPHDIIQFFPDNSEQIIEPLIRMSILH